MPQGAGLEVDEPGGVEGVALVAGLEVQVRTAGAAGGAAQADDIARVHPVARLLVAAGQMAVEGLQAVRVPDDDQVAVAAHVVGHADFAVEGGIHRRAGGIGKVDALVTAAVPIAELGVHAGLVRAAVGVQRVHDPQGKAVREGLLVVVRVHAPGVPVLREDLFVLDGLGVLDIAVGAVVVQDDLDRGIRGVQRVGVGRGGAARGTDAHPPELVAERVGFVVILRTQGNTGGQE